MISPRRRGSGLRTQLVSNALVGIVLPATLAGGVSLFLLTYHLDIIEASFDRSREVLTNEIARTELIGRANDTARRIDTFLIGRIAEAKAWASAGIVVDAARTAHGRHEAEGLIDAPVQEIERRFRAQKSLGLWSRADSYLRQQVAGSPYFAEIFFTDRNGFNVAMTNATSDFVQSDESWWKSAWLHGSSVGDVAYDESAGVWSVDISIRIDGPDGNAPLGVMKTVLAIEPLQKIADEAARNVPGGLVNVATGRGSLIAETGSGHDPQRIMSEEVNLRERSEPSLRASFDAEPAGFSVDGIWLTSYARTGGNETYASTIGRFAGFDWIVIVQKPVAAIHEPIAALRGIDEALRDWRLVLALAFGATIILCASLAIVLSAGAARRYASALDAVSEMAERSARGQPVRLPIIEDPKEIVRVNDAVQGLVRLCNRVSPPRLAR